MEEIYLKALLREKITQANACKRVWRARLLSESLINGHCLILRACELFCQRNVSHFCGRPSLRSWNIYTERKRFMLGILLLLLFKYVKNKVSWTHSALFPCTHTTDSMWQTGPGLQGCQGGQGSCSSSHCRLGAAMQTISNALTF